VGGLAEELDPTKQEETMGDRRHVVIKETSSPDVYLYTHWGGHDLPETVQEALSREERWDDGPYLARIIFCHMINGATGGLGGTTGLGISASYLESEYDDVIVDVSTNEVRIGESAYSFKEYLKKAFRTA
jgi:hypothetical protein